MKAILILLLFITNANAFYVAVGPNFSTDCGSMNLNYPKKSQCEKDHPDKFCVQMPVNFSCDVFDAADIMGDDLSNPNYEAASQIDPCSGKDNCLSLLAAKSCGPNMLKFANKEYTQIYCTKILSYQQKVVSKSLTVNATKKAVRDAKKQAKLDAKAAKKASLNAIKAKMISGQDPTAAELRAVLIELMGS